MSFNFKIKIVITLLLSVYAGITIFMVNMNLIPPDMFFIEVFDFITLTLIIFLLLYRMDALERRSKKNEIKNT